MAEVIALYNDKDIMIVQIYSTSSITCGEVQLLENCLAVCVAVLFTKFGLTSTCDSLVYKLLNTYTYYAPYHITQVMKRLQLLQVSWKISLKKSNIGKLFPE